ncbi:hypothetical protein ATERTT37_000761 [Aspergillus terreus]
MDMVDIGEGRVLPSSGHAEYTIKYRAIIWKPFRGETVDAIVTSVKPTGIFTLAGPLAVFIARKNIPSDIKWEPNTVPPQYTDHADQVIEKGTSLRLKILGVKPDVAAINAIGTIKEDYLGRDDGSPVGERFYVKCENNCTIHSQSGIPVGSEAFQWSIRSSIPSSMIEREFVAGETRRRKGETLKSKIPEINSTE